MLEKVIHIALEALFPPACAGCGAKNISVCKHCIDTSSYRGSECFFCGLAAQKNNICRVCRPRQPFEAIVWPWRYNNTQAKTIIAAYKYRKRRALAPILGKVLAGSLAKLDLPQDITVLAIPLHPDKLRERGFNQAELLARELAFPLALDAVARVKYTPPQARAASRREREAQVKGAFAVAREDLIRGKNILIIDDVATTGATLCEVGNILKKAGAGKIYAAVIAHG